MYEPDIYGPVAKYYFTIQLWARIYSPAHHVQLIILPVDTALNAGKAASRRGT